MNERRWRPLLEDEIAEEAWAAIRATGDRLAAGEADSRNASARPESPSLSGGATGIAVFLRYLAHALPAEGYADPAERYLERGLSGLAAWPLPHGLYAGFTGIAWALRHLEDPGDDDYGTEPLDELLLSMLDRPDPRAEYDLISGLVGLAVYGVEALPHPFGRRLLERVVARLDELREETDQGTTWYTPPERIPPSQKEAVPEGYYNLGVAHGVPATIVLLAACFLAGAAQDRSRRLLAGAVSWLLAQRQGPEVGSSFPTWIAPGLGPHRSRLAWCYGDPGVGAALLAAGRAAGEPAWEAAGVEVLRGAARRPGSSSGIKDVGLCHGSAGLAHLFNRAWQMTGDEELRRAALHWYRETLDMRRPGEGVAGFLSWEPDGQDGLVLRGVPGILTGASGVALALLAGVTAIEPEWDRMLALSVPAGIRPPVGVEAPASVADRTLPEPPPGAAA